MLGDRADLSVSVTEPLERFAVHADHDRFVSADGRSPESVTSVHDSDALVWGADLVGLAAALAETLDAATLMAVAHGNDGSDATQGEPVRFPPPVGTRDAYPAVSPLPATRLLTAPGLDEWSALRVTGDRTLAMVDDGRFASAVILAAAAVMPPGPVWEHSHEFLTESKKLGLSFARAV